MEKTAAAYIRKYRLDQILEERHVSMLELKTWKRRDILLHADTELHHLLFLVEGKAKTSYISANGQTVLHSFLYPLSILGEVELWKQTDSCYQKAALAADAEKMLGLENCFISMAREAVFECMVCI